MSQPYAEYMIMRQDVSYIPYAISPKGKTRNIITFTQFEEGGLLSETSNNIIIFKKVSGMERSVIISMKHG